MSRKLLAFLLSELKTIRLRCMKCKLVLETSLADLPKSPTDRCQRCNNDFRRAGADCLSELGNAVLNAVGVAGQVEVEFVLPDNVDAPAKP